MIYREKSFLLKNEKKLIVKTPEICEASDLLKFIQHIVEETNYLLSTYEDMNFSIEKEESFISTMRDGKDYLICAYIDGKIIGDCSLSFDRHVKLRHRANIGIGIKKEFWGVGIGSILFEIMIELAKQTEGIEQLNLAYLGTNLRGKTLYEKFGFVETGIIPKAIKQKDGSYEDEVYMTKFLDD